MILLSFFTKYSIWVCQFKSWSKYIPKSLIYWSIWLINNINNIFPYSFLDNLIATTILHHQMHYLPLSFKETEQAPTFITLIMSTNNDIILARIEPWDTPAIFENEFEIFPGGKTTTCFLLSKLLIQLFDYL